VILDPDFEVLYTICAGAVIFRKPAMVHSKP